MSNIYIIMEKVDLGGDPVIAYIDESEAVYACANKNIYDKQQHAQALLNLGYTQEMVNERVVYREQFYVQEVSLK